MKIKNLIFLILVLTAVLRLVRLDFPNHYVFDEVYHAFTAKEYLKNNPSAWDPWATPPKGVAFEWTHPPLAKEIMANSMMIFNSTDAWAWRLPGAIMGIISVYLVYYLAKLVFKEENIALISAFIFSLDGLTFVQSRTGMNDIYFLTFALTSLIFFIRKRFLFTAIFFGLALSSKWTAIYLLPFFAFFIIRNKNIKAIFYLLIIPPLVYLTTYIPYFLLGYDLKNFWELQQQMWWYHTKLKATHDYASAWWSWPLNLYPVWYFVDYQGDKIANIFASGNPVMFWFGTVAIILTFFEFIKNKSIKIFIILAGFFIFWLPWAFSPRIMFLYHYSPSVPFLSITLGYQINKLFEDKQKKIAILLLVLITLGFAAMYPFLTGIPIPKDWVKYFFYTNVTKNPF